MTARTEALEAQLRVAMSKAERREAVRAFMSDQTSTQDVRGRARANVDLRNVLNTAVEGNLYELRAAGEATGSAGGDLVAPEFASTVIRYLKEYDSVLADCEDLPTETGATWARPQVSAWTAAGSAISENTQLSDSTGTLVTFAGQQQFGETPAYAALMRTSFQLATDANIDAVDLLGSAAQEALGRQLASVASTALYAAATSGQEVALGSLTVSNVAKLLADLDPAHLSGARMYVSPSDYSTLASNDPTGLRNLAALIPGGVRVTHAATNWVTSTVSGPVLANLGNFMTLRRVNGIGVQVLRERYADLAQLGVVVHIRADFQASGQVSAAVFSK